MVTMIQDIRYGLRMLRKSPGFTAIAVISLGLAIGANTAVFSLYNAVMLKSLPVRHPRQLRVLNWAGNLNTYTSYCRRESTPDGQTKANVFSYPIYCELRDYAAKTAELFAFSAFDNYAPLTVLVDSQASTAHGLIVSGNFFSGLGIDTWAGQAITQEHDQPQAEPVTVISHIAWQRYFNSNPQAIGKTITLNKNNFTIIGILPQGFLGPVTGDRSDFYIPMSAQPMVRPDCPLATNDVWWIQVMARVSPDTSYNQFRDSMSTWFGRTVANEGFSSSDSQARIMIEDGSGGPLGSRHYIGQSLPVLMGIVCVVLLAACANLASLSLARGAFRQQEMAVRAAMGAGKWRLIRQSLTESLLVALAGAFGGLLLATWGKQVLFNMFWPSGVVVDLGLDKTVLGFTLIICVVSALLFGVLPAWRWSRINPMVSLKERSSCALSRMRLGKWMVSLQTALAMLLLVGAGLFVRTLVNLYKVNTGFRTENLLVFSLDGRKADIKNQQLAGFYEQVRSAIETLPSVRGVAHSNLLLLTGWMNNSMAQIPGRPAEDKMPILGLSVSNSFLSTMDISLLLGRDFSIMDNEAGQPVILVNEALARTAFPEQNPIGQTLTIDREYNIVGVFEDITYVRLKKAPEPTVFYPCRQQAGYPGKIFYEVRTASNPMAIVPAIRQIVADINSNIPMADIKTQAIQLDESIAQERCFTAIASGLAFLAILLSCIGLFGLMAYQTAQRTGEMGIRMALGSTAWNLVWPVLRSALLMATAGITIGLLMVFAAVRLIRNYLFGVEQYDFGTIVAAMFVLIIVSILASWIPARRAAKVNPMEALRYE
jgi:predicted permease